MTKMKKLTALLIIFSVLGIYASAAVVPEWFVPEGWSVTNTSSAAKATVDITEAKSGAASFKTQISEDYSDGSVKILQKVTGLTPSANYTFSFWAKCENADYFKIIRDTIHSIDAKDTAADGWYQKSVSFTTGKSSQSVTLQFMIKGAASTVWIDDCSLKADGSDEELLTNGGFEEGLCLTPPDKIEGFFAVAKNKSVKLFWDKAENADKVEIYKDGELAKTVSAELTSCVISGLENGREYVFSVKAVDSWSNASPISETKATPSAKAEVSVLEYGADGTDDKDDTTAFEKAFSDDENVVIVPTGAYYLSSLTIPEGKTLKAAGKAIVKTLDSPDSFIVMKKKSAIDGVTLINENEVQKGISVVWSANVNIKNCEIFGFADNGIYNDHGDGMTVENTAVKNSRIGIESVFSSDITVKGCYVKNSSVHGIQFWNNDNGVMVGGNHHYENNTVISSGGGGIWGTGASKVYMYDNKVDGCGDVGLDLEYCSGGIIKNNVVSRCKNAGISVFHGSDNILIADNVIFNNHPTVASSNVRAGIWITRIDRNISYDSGNKNIGITNNTIYNATDSANRRGIFLPVYKDDIKYNYTVSGNKISGGGCKTALLIGSTYYYPEYDGFVFSKNGDSTLEEIESSSTEPYELLQNVNPGLSVGAGTTAVINNEAKGMGTYIAEIELKGNAGNITVSAKDKEQNKIVASIGEKVINSSGNSVFALKFDSLGGGNIVYEVSNTSATAAEVIGVRVYAAKLPFVQILSDRYGIEYINNSYTELKTVLKILRPERNGIKSYFLIERITNNEKLNVALYRE